MDPLFCRQGCSKAIVGAVALNTILKSLDLRQPSAVTPANFSKLFFESQASKIEPVWYELHKNVFGIADNIHLGKDRKPLVRFALPPSPRCRLIINQVDYEHDTTVPISGDKLSDGWFKRWYGSRLTMISSHVCPSNHRVIDQLRHMCVLSGSPDRIGPLEQCAPYWSSNRPFPAGNSLESTVGRIEAP